MPQPTQDFAPQGAARAPQTPPRGSAPPADALWQRLSAHPFDDPGDAHPLSARLARQQGWRRTHTDRVLTEYRRFLYLAVRLNGRACPSTAVDAAWHTHLLDSRRYFGDFGPRVLGRALHHVPSRGGGAEDARHTRRYRATLRAYRLMFGHAPPPDIWPSPSARFAERTRELSSRTHWALPKPAHGLRLLADAAHRHRRALRAVAAATVLPALLVLGCAPQTSVQPHTSGPAFLGQYLLVMAALVVWGIWQAVRGRAATVQPVRAEGLSAVDLAYLSGGALRAVQTALATLLQHDAIALRAAAPATLASGWQALAAPPIDAHPLAQAVHTQVRAEASPAALLKGLQPALDALHTQLQARGLLTGAERARRHRSAADRVYQGAWLLLLAWGGWRVLHGLQRGLPVGLLCILMVVGALLFALFRHRLPRRQTREGMALLQRHRAALRHRSRLKPADPLMPLGLALLGPAVLAPELGGLHAPFASLRPSDHTSSGCGGGGCGSAGGGDGGGSDGGSGCGGCGGGGD